MTDLPPPPVSPPPPGWSPLPDPPPGPRFEPLRGLATALTVLLIVDAVVAVLLAGAAGNRATVIGRYLSDDASIGDLEDADSGIAGAVVFFALLTVAVAVVWIVWQYRHARNAQLLGGGLPLGPGWAIGGWFIPLAGLVLGPLQLRQAAAASDPRLGIGPPQAGPRGGRVPGVLFAWWITFAVAGVISTVSGVIRPGEGVRLGTAADYLRDVQAADRVTALAALVYVAAAILALLTVRALTERQEATMQRRA